ncbi:hypothetical protein SPAR_44078, partial [Streptomyces sparsogenes DSM 40356]
MADRLGVEGAVHDPVLGQPQRTAFTRLVAPTPMMAEVMTWVVEIGAWYMNDAVYMTEAAVVSAA